MSRRPHRNNIVLFPELVRNRVENKPHAARFFLYIANILYIPFYKTKIEGTTPYHRPTLVALIFYGFFKGHISADDIIDMAEDSIGATWILGGMSIPSYKTVDRVIDDILDNIDLIFMQIIQLCQAFNLIGGERTFIDGTKTKANASKHKAMSHGYLNKKINNTKEKIQDSFQEIMEYMNVHKNLSDEELFDLVVNESKEIHKKAQAIHRKRLKLRRKSIFNGQNPGEIKNSEFDSVPEEQLQIFEFIDSDETEEIKKTMDTIGYQASRLETMKEGKENLEKKYKKENEDQEIPEDKQINFTDPESSIMVTKHNGIKQCYNNFGLVDDKAHIIVGTYTSNDSNDKKGLIPTVEDTIKNLGNLKGIELGSDSGFYSAENIRYCKEKQIDYYTSIPEAKSSFAKDKFQYNEKKDTYLCPENQELFPPENPREGSKTRRYKTDKCIECESQNDCTKAKDGIRKIIRNLNDDPIREQATEKAKTEKGTEILAQRKSVPEPVWGNMQKQDGLIQLHYRGLDKASKEFKLRCAMHNLRKLFKVFVNNPKARIEIENMGLYPSQAVS